METVCDIFRIYMQVLLLEPAVHYHLTDVTYYLNELDLIGDKPVHLATATFINRDINEHVISQTLTCLQ